MGNYNPIGFFDSGVGGLSIWEAVNKLLPYERTIYLADSKNAPYGQKSPAEILELSIRNTELLLEHNCKLIVVACNTATTNAISELRERYEVPFIGIEPAIKPAAINTRTRRVGVLATKGTLGSSLFNLTAKSHAKDIEILEKEGTGLVELVEAGRSDSEEAETLLRELLEPMIAADVDHLVLGCTHYPFLTPLLRKILPGNVTIIDCARPVAMQTQRVLDREGLLASENEGIVHRFYGNEDISVMARFLSMNKQIKEIHHLDF